MAMLVIPRGNTDQHNNTGEKYIIYIYYDDNIERRKSWDEAKRKTLRALP